MIFKKMNNNRISGRERESGNVLFLILIAVALFAALSYAVTQSTRSGGGDAGRETNRISSAQLTQYPAGVRTSIVRMIIGGADINTLEFNDPSKFANCTSVGTALKKKRCVFHPEGGGATYVLAPKDIMASGTTGGWIFTGANEIENVGTTVLGAPVGAIPSASVDLIAFLPGIARGVCESINNALGLPDNPIPVETGIEYTSAAGMINPNGTTDTTLEMTLAGDSIGVAAPALLGQPFGCFNDTNGNVDNGTAQQYVYYHVLIER